MNWRPEGILAVLDRCCENFTFPMLDNGYVHLAATRLSLYRSPDDWALVIEVFGFSPRSGIPDTQVHTFASRLNRQASASDYASPRAFEAYLANNPHNESAFIFPIEEGDWIDAEDPERLARAGSVLLRGEHIGLPPLQAYAARGIDLQAPPEVRVFEFCRFLAATARGGVLATADERRGCVPPELEQILQLEAWHHPDLVNGARPGTSATFRSLADVLVHGDMTAYQPSRQPNTHWENWPDGGSL